jgi:phosphoribosylaminoimidazolecarboxamide formyltransferase / IMP cyclohydrolase
MDLNYVNRTEDRVPVRNILLSVADKSGLEEFVRGMMDLSPELRFYSTGGTFARLEEILNDEASSRLVRVADYTGQPEMQGGLVKTLDFKIYLSLLSESYNDSHREDMDRTGAVPFDMTVVNLYPFEKTVADPASTIEHARANIDIGGPCMLRASAKNFLRVAAVCDPADYGPLIEELKAQGGATSLGRRFSLAKKAFAHTAAYDAAIAAYLSAVGPADLNIYSSGT